MKKLTLIGVVALAAPLYADGHKVKPGKYHIVIRHELVGMPYTPPPTAMDKCITPEDADKPDKLAHNANDKCEQKAFKQSGNKLTFEVVCHDRGGTQTGTGEYVFGVDRWSGTITVAMKEPRTGMDIKMINHLESTRTGDCAK